MKKIAAVLALSLMIGVSAQAGTITFTPQGPTELGGGGPTSVDFIVGFQNDFGADFDNGFTAAAVDIGVNGGPTVSFVFDAGFLAAFQLSSPDPSTVFDSAFLLNAFSFTAGGLLPFENVGTLTVSVDESRDADGLYEVQAIGTIANAGAVSADVFGNASFSVVPEPATISLLALGALGLLRRRKTA